MKLDEMIHDWNNHPMVAAAYAAGLSDGQELAECKIRGRLATVPLGRYHREQMSAVDYVLQDNRHCYIAPICPEGPELRSWSA